MIQYVGFQVCLIGSFVAVADVLKNKKDAAKTAISGFVINANIFSCNIYRS